MGILISNERNAKQAVRTEENKKVNRGVTASGPGSRAALRGSAAARTRKTFSRDFVSVVWSLGYHASQHFVTLHSTVAKYSNFRNCKAQAEVPGRIFV